MNIEAILLVIGSLAGLVVYFKRKADTARKDAIMGDTQGQDKILAENQAEARKKVEAADDSIKDIMKERERLRKEYEAKTAQERADGWNKND